MLRSTPPATIGGFAEPGFGPVADAFRENFEKRDEVGASVCVRVGGKVVVDLWGGVKDRKSRELWNADSMQLMFSATKGLAATCFMHLADNGGFDFDAPVAQYWGDRWNQAGKEGITVRTLLNHRSGLCALDAPLSLDAVERWSLGQEGSGVVEAMEAQRPLWSPGTAQGYHGVTFGFYAGELFRRISGRSIGEYLRNEIAGPLGADVFLGLPASEEPRVSTLYTSGPGVLLKKIIPRILLSRGVEGRVYRQYIQRKSDTARAFANPKALGLTGVKNFGTARVRAMELPWASAVGTARGLATFYGALATPDAETPLVSPEAIAPARERQSWGWDRVLRKPMGFSQGYVKDELHLFSPCRDTFGHPGAGGALGYADPANDMAFGYVMNRMDFRLRSPRCLELSRAVYRCLQ